MESEVYLKLFGQHIKKMRLKRNLSIQQVSHICSTSEKDLIQLENGQFDCPLVLLFNIAEVLNVELHELFSFDFKGYTYLHFLVIFDL